jgi:hypothetical protein
MNILDPTFESAVEGLAATEAPCFLCFTIWTAIPSRGAFSFSLSGAWTGEARAELVFDCYRTRIIIFTSTFEDSGVV